MPRLTNDQKKELVCRYESGELCADLAREFGVDRSSAYSLLRRRGVKMQSRSYIHRKQKGHFLNESKFNEVNQESAYWVGFLAADGSIFKNIVSLALSEKDEWHLHKFRLFMEGSQKIIQVNSRHGKSCRYAFQSEKVVKALLELGVSENKSLTYLPHSCLIGSRDYWRGMVDGDGHVAIHNHRGRPLPRLELCGSFGTIKAFSRVCSKLTGKSNKVSKNKSIYRISFGGNSAAAISEYLYDDCDLALDRKALSAWEIHEWQKLNK